MMACWLDQELNNLGMVHCRLEEKQAPELGLMGWVVNCSLATDYYSSDQDCRFLGTLEPNNPTQESCQELGCRYLTLELNNLDLDAQLLLGQWASSLAPEALWAAHTLWSLASSAQGSKT